MKKTIGKHLNKLIFAVVTVLIGLVIVANRYGTPKLLTNAYAKLSWTAIAAGSGEGLVAENLKSVPLADTEKPSIPTNLHWIDKSYYSLECGNAVSDLKAGSVKAYWDSSTDNVEVDHYEYVSFNPPNGLAWPSLDLGHVVTHSVYSNNTYIPLVGTYGFMVRAVDTAGNKSAWSNVDRALEGSCQVTYSPAI